VARFEAAQGGAAAPQAPKPVAASSGVSAVSSEFDKKVLPLIKPFEDAAKALNSEIITTIVSRITE
jgi:hypothetical protein